VSPPADLVAISVPTPYAVGRVNCYLLPGEPLTLIDTGPSSTEARAALEAGLAEEGVSLADVELVLLTHQHSDHEGLAGAVREASGCVVGAHADVVELLGDYPAGLAREDAYQAEIMQLHGVPAETVEALRIVSRGFHGFGASLTVDLPLDDGELVTAGGRTLRAAYRPGHSPSDTLYVDEEHGLAFAGDHLLAHISSNPIAHRPLRGEADPRRRPATLPGYLDSLARTAELGLDVVHPGHGEPIHDPRRLVGERIARQQARTAQVREAVSAGPLSAHAIARSMWGDVAIRQAYLTLSEVLGALDVLAAEHLVVELESAGGLEYAAA